MLPMTWLHDEVSQVKKTNAQQRTQVAEAGKPQEPHFGVIKTRLSIHHAAALQL